MTKKNAIEEDNIMEKPNFDLDAAHRHFSVACFNQAWALLDKPDRTPRDG